MKYFAKGAASYTSVLIITCHPESFAKKSYRSNDKYYFAEDEGSPGVYLNLIIVM